MVERVCKAPVLMLDDLGAERLTPFAEEQLFLPLDHRHRLELPTMVITNLALEDLPPRIGSRLADRKLCRVVLNPAADYR
jgi:DNA replication protein DnaC